MAHPTIGRIVHYYDREEIVNAEQAKRKAEPYAAIVTRVHKDLDGKPLDVVNLNVFDPEVGVQIVRDVTPGEDADTPTPHQWYWPKVETPAQAAAAQRQEDKEDAAAQRQSDKDAKRAEDEAAAARKARK